MVLGFSGVVIGGFQGFLRLTSEAFLPRSMPRRTRWGERGAVAKYQYAKVEK